jgi:hypothetical protein
VTTDREAEVADAFVSLASSLANGYDVVDLLSQLTAECVRLLNVPAAGLLLADGLGVLHLLAASSERMRLLELFQLQRDEGPCRDCFHSGAPVSVPDLDEERERWPQFVPAALEAGFASVHAVPMRWRDEVLGSLGLFGTDVGALEPRDLALGQALADVATVALVQEQAAVDRIAVNDQLQQALTSRIVIEQAKGLLAQQGDLDMLTAFAILRRYARDHNRRLTDLAQEVVERKLSARELLHHARSKGVSIT